MLKFKLQTIELIKKIRLEDENANMFVKSCYDILMEIVRAKMLLDGKPGWICVKRNHNERYGVTGSASELDRKVAVGRWPTLLSETIQQKTPLEQKSSSTISIN